MLAVLLFCCVLFLRSPHSLPTLRAFSRVQQPNGVPGLLEHARSRRGLLLCQRHHQTQGKISTDPSRIAPSFCWLSAHSLILTSLNPFVLTGVCQCEQKDIVDALQGFVSGEMLSVNCNTCGKSVCSFCVAAFGQLGLGLA